MITFICALPQEAKHLRTLPSVLNGQARLICSGVGPRNAGRATREHLAEFKPTLVISTGVAGALSPTLHVGDVVVAGQVIDATTGQRFECNPQFVIRDPKSTILSVYRMITSADEKKSVGIKFNATAVDMESAAIAHVCAERSVPFVAIRAISDTSDEVLPEAITSFFDTDGKLRLGRVITELIRKPSLMKALRRLQFQTAIAGNALRTYLDAHPF